MLKQQIQAAQSVKEVKRLVAISKGFHEATPKTIRQINREADRTIARLNVPKK